MADKIVIRGAKEHNLKNVSLELPRDKLIVFTGLSGSGKSSLAFDTIYAEGQRRYVESLSSYARQFLGQMDKPDVEIIEGLSPAISIDQKSASRNPRSTVGTVTEVYDYLRLLYARVGTPHDPETGEALVRQTPQQIVDQMLGLPEGTRFQVLAPWSGAARAPTSSSSSTSPSRASPACGSTARSTSWPTSPATSARTRAVRDARHRGHRRPPGAARRPRSPPHRVDGDGARPRRGRRPDRAACPEGRREPELLTFSEKLSRPSDGKSFEELAPRELLVQLALRLLPARARASA